MSDQKKENAETPKASGFWCFSCRPRVIFSPLYLSAIFLAVLFVLPRLLHSNFLFPLIKKVAATTYGAKISASHSALNIWNEPHFTMYGFTLHKKGDTPLLKADIVKLNLNPWSVIKGKSALDKLTLLNPEFTLVRGKDNTYNLPGSDGEAVDAPDLALPALSTVASLDLVGGTVHWRDFRVADTPVETDITNLIATISHENISDSAPFHLRGHLEGEKGPSLFSLDGALSSLTKNPSFSGKIEVDRISFDEYWPYLKHILPFDRLNCDLSLDASFSGDLARGFSSNGIITLSGLKLLYKKAFSRSIAEDRITLTYAVDGTSKNLDITNLKLSAGPISIKASGKASEMTSDNPRLNVHISTNNIDVNDLRRYLPDNALPPVELNFIKNNLKSGFLALKDFKFDGDFNKLKNLDKPESLKAFDGVLVVSNMKIAFKKAPYPLHDIGGEITIVSDTLLFSDITARYRGNALNKIYGSVKDLYDAPHFNVYIKAGFNLAETRDFLLRELTSREFMKQIKKIKWAKGVVNLDLQLSGEAFAPISGLMVNGKLALSKVGMSHDTFGLPVTGLNGVIEGNFDDIHISQLDWMVGNSPFYLSGNLYNAFSADPVFDIFMTTSVDLKDMQKISFLNTKERRQEQLGVAEIIMKLNGKFGDFHVSNTVDMTKAGFTVPGLVKKSVGSPLIYEFDGDVKDQEHIAIRNLDLTVGESVIDVTGRIDQFLWGEGIDLTFTTDGFMLDDADNFFAFLDDIKGAGLAKGRISVFSSKSERIRLTGNLEIENATFKLPTFSSTFSECNGRFDLVNDKIFLKNGTGVFGLGRFTANGIGILDKIPSFTLNVKTTALTEQDLFGPNRRQYKKKDYEQPQKRRYLDGLWNINLHSDSGKIGYLTYTDLNTTVKYNEKVFTLNPFMFLAHGGAWSLEGSIDTLTPGKIGYDTIVQIQDLDMIRFESEAYGSASRFISGPFNLRGEFKGVGATWREIKRSMEGLFTLRSGSGEIRKFAMLSKIFSLLNVTQYFKNRTPNLDADGMPFTSISGDFIVKEGIATTKKLYVDSEAIRLVGHGDYDIADSIVDMAVLAAPFGTIDWMISSIPLLGYVLAGEEKSFLASSFTVKGPLDDPQVNMIPFESFARSVLGILERLVELPSVTIRAMEGKRDTGFVLPFDEERIIEE